MEKSYFPKNNIINGNNSSNEALKYNINNDKIENKLKLRKNAYNKILKKKNAIFVEKITNEKMIEIENLEPEHQYRIIKSHLISYSEPNIIKILSYVIDKYCSLYSEDMKKLKILDEGIIDNILNLFYTTINNDIFSLCSTILSIFCTDYILFSIKMIKKYL